MVIDRTDRITVHLEETMYASYGYMCIRHQARRRFVRFDAVLERQNDTGPADQERLFQIRHLHAANREVDLRQAVIRCCDTERHFDCLAAAIYDLRGCAERAQPLPARNQHDIAASRRQDGGDCTSYRARSDNRNAHVVSLGGLPSA